jgi:hypothetical protein
MMPDPSKNSKCSKVKNEEIKYVEDGPGSGSEAMAVEMRTRVGSETDTTGCWRR